jgi:N-acetylglucosaminyl-diphospho-decaprenol L-rhamnosyltransferase
MDPHVPSPVLLSSLRPCRQKRTVGAPSLSVVVVNYQHWEDTVSLLRQLRASPLLRRGCAEVLIIDNHSPHHTVIPRLRRLSGVSLLRWRRNRGFARAVNEGCRLGRGAWLLLLNPDMSVDPAFLDKARTRGEHLCQQDPTVGIIGFGLRDADGSRQLSAGRFPTLPGTLARLLLPRRRRKYTHTPVEKPSSMDWVTGCCMLIRRECWQQLGGFDPDFFLYYEDVDLCKRARALGWSVVHDPGLTAVHHRPLHGRSVAPPLRGITRHGLLTYASKHWSSWETGVLARIIQVEAWLRNVLTRGRQVTPRRSSLATLAAMARSFQQQQFRDARRHLLRLVRLQEEALDVAVDCDPKPQSP